MIMAESEYSKYVVKELKSPFSPEVDAAYAKVAKRILWMDDKVVPGSAFQMSCSWYLKPIPGGPPAHTHAAPEILGFFGNDPDDPYNLHGEIEIWLGDQKFIINKTAMVFIPPGLKHCALRVNRIDKPIFHFSVVKAGQWDASTLEETHKPEADYSKYIVTELKAPTFKPGFAERYKQFSTRVLWMDKNVCPGSFQMNVSWYCKPVANNLSHVHEDSEIIAFFGGNAEDPYNLNAEVEMWIGDLQNKLTRSTMLYAQAGVKHCPLIVHRADQPIFHFSIVTGGTYNNLGK